MFENLAQILDAAINRVNQVSRWIARLGGLILIATVLMIVVEVSFRKLAGRSVFPATEISGYFMAIIASWSFAYAMLEKAHIRIDIFYMKSSHRLRNLLDILSICSLALVCVYATDAAMAIAFDAYESNARSNSPLMTPLWIPQTLWLLGFVWFTISVFLLLLRALVALFCHDQSRFSNLLSSPSVDDHINEISRN